MERKALVLNASPRKSGLVAAMTARIADGLAAQGWQIETVYVNDCRVAPCRGCMVCRNSGDCVLPADDAQRVLESMRRADVLIVGAPCYWGNMPGTLKLLFDRMVYGLMTIGAHGLPKGLMSPRRCVLVTTSTTPWPWNRLLHQTSGTVRALREVLTTGGYRVVGTIQRGDTRSHTALNATDMRRCDRLAQRLIGG
jgi:putative NADPH-quinone reductase